MATILSRSSSTDALNALAKSRLAEKAKQMQWVEKYPDSLEAGFIQGRLKHEAERDEVQLEKLARRNDAVDFNTSEILNLNDKEQLVLKGDKVMITRIGTGEVLYESTRRAGKLLWSLPSRREALEQMEAAGAVKKIKLPLVNVVPLARIRKEALFSTIRKTLKDFSAQKELAQQEYAANMSTGKEQAEKVLVERRHSIAQSLQHDLDSIFEDFESADESGSEEGLSSLREFLAEKMPYTPTIYVPRSRGNTENWPFPAETSKHRESAHTPETYIPTQANRDKLSVRSEAAATEESLRIFEKHRAKHRLDSGKVFSWDSSDSSVADETDWYAYDAQNLGTESMLNAAVTHLSSPFRIM